MPQVTQIARIFDTHPDHPIMASVSQRRTRRYSNYESPRQAPAYRPKPRRWIKRLVIGTTLLGILGLVAPMIVANTPLRNAPLRSGAA